MTTTRLPRIPTAVLAGATLGSLACYADELDGWVGKLSIALTGSGFAWGAAALMAAFATRRPRAAVTSAVSLLVAATITYYGLILLVNRRWQGGWLEDGSSADTMALASLGQATLVWLAIALLGGLVLGCLGHAIRHRPGWAGSAAAGLALGLLAGEGFGDLVLLVPVVPTSAFTRATVIAAGITVALAGWTTTTLLALRRLDSSWWIYSGAAACSLATSATLWQLIASLGF